MGSQVETCLKSLPQHNTVPGRSLLDIQALNTVCSRRGSWLWRSPVHQSGTFFLPNESSLGASVSITSRAKLIHPGLSYKPRHQERVTLSAPPCPLASTALSPPAWKILQVGILQVGAWPGHRGRRPSVSILCFFPRKELAGSVSSGLTVYKGDPALT